jgi:hypothetical protein
MTRGTVIGTHAAARTIRNSVLPRTGTPNFGDKRKPGFAWAMKAIDGVQTTAPCDVISP